MKNTPTNPIDPASKTEDTQDGTVGFSPQYSGNAKSDHDGTSGVGNKSKLTRLPDDITGGVEVESGKEPNTSANGRIV